VGRPCWLSLGREAGLRSARCVGSSTRSQQERTGSRSSQSRITVCPIQGRSLPCQSTHSRWIHFVPVRARDGSLWFTIPRKGVYRFKDHVLTSFGPADGLTDNSIWALLPDEAGGIWAGASTGLFHWNEGRWSQEIATDGVVLSIFHSKRFGMLLGTSNGIVMVRDGHRWVLPRRADSRGEWSFPFWKMTCRICGSPRRIPSA